MKTPSLLVLVLLAQATAGSAAEPPGPSQQVAGVKALRVYVAGESIEQYNRYVAPPFTATGALNDRGGGDLRNDMEEYGWMVPLRDRLTLRAPDLTIQFVGSGTWTEGGDYPYSGTYPSTEPEPTSAIAGTSIPSWVEQRRGELEGKTFCYDLAFASRSGNDFGNDNDEEYRDQLKELILLLWRGSSCRTDPVVVVTGHMPDDQRDYTMSDAAYVALAQHRFVERARQAVNEIAAAQPTLRVRFVDQYTPFLDNKPTTAFPSEVWSTNRIPDFDKIARGDDRYHPRRLASIYAGELAADGLDLAEMRALVGSSPTLTYTWLLPSSARVQGDRGLLDDRPLAPERRDGGRDGDGQVPRALGRRARRGRDAVTLAPGETWTWGDVLSTLFGLSADWGPILVRSESSELVVLGQTSTPGSGGTFGQSVPAFSGTDLIGETPRSILGVRQDACLPHQPHARQCRGRADRSPRRPHDARRHGPDDAAGPARAPRLRAAQRRQRPRRGGRLRRRHRGLDADARRALRRLRLRDRPGHGRPADPPARSGRGRRVAPPLERAGAGGRRLLDDRPRPAQHELVRHDGDGEVPRSLGRRARAVPRPPSASG